MKARIRYVFARRGMNRHNKGRVDIEVYFDRDTRIYVDTGLRLLDSEWNHNKSMPFVNTKPGQAYLKTILDTQRKIEDHEFQLILKGEELKPWMIKELIRGTLNNSTTALSKFIEDELEKDNTLDPLTRKAHSQTLNKLKEFDPITPLDRITYDFVRKFNSFLIEKGLHPNTIERHHTRIKRYLYLAVKYDLIDKNPYKDFKLVKQPTNKVALNQEELDRIESADYSGNERMGHVRDLFLFSCWTGLRYNELKGLKMENLVSTSQGYEITLHEIRKYPHPLFLPLGKLFGGKPDKMLSKWMVNGELCLQVVNNAQLNLDLKQIAFDCSVEKVISWHTARRTFATELGALTGNVYLIAALLGHKDIKTSLVYVKMTPANVVRSLSSVRWE